MNYIERLKPEVNVRLFNENDVIGMIDPKVLHELTVDCQCDIQISTDETAVQVDVVKDDRIWSCLKVRDRSKDGKNWYPTRLTDWNFGKQEDEFTLLGRAFEVSSYWGHPMYDTRANMSDELSVFVKNPFSLIPFDNPTYREIEKWMNNWDKVQQILDYPHPGKISMQTLPGAVQYIKTIGNEILKKKGYDYSTSIPTWYHVSMLLDKYGYEYHNRSDKDCMDRLKSRLPGDLKKASWIMVLQYVNELAENNGISPEKLSGYVLRDEQGAIMKYPLSPDYNYWRYKVI